MENLKISEDNPRKIVLKPRREIVIEELQSVLDKQLDKIDLIKDFMSLHCDRRKIKDELALLRNKTAEAKETLQDARQKIQIFKTVQLPQTLSLIDGMRKQHLEMLKMLEQMDKPVKTSIVKSSDENSNASPEASLLLETPKALNRKTFSVHSQLNTITPKSHQSPFVVRADPRVMSKLNRQFQICIDSTDFDKIPKYMKGRDSLDELSTFLETVIVKCFIDKYTLLHRDRENVQPPQMQRWKMYRMQMEYFPGEMFITEGDISTLLGRMMDKKMNNRIAMLRHLHIIQDVRHGQATCFLWKGKK